MLEHGGRLHAASLRYGIPRQDWLDLSTGINPAAYPLPPIPADAWQRLPEDDDGLAAAARAAFGADWCFGEAKFVHELHLRLAVGDFFSRFEDQGFILGGPLAGADLHQLAEAGRAFEFLDVGGGMAGHLHPTPGGGFRNAGVLLDQV